MTVAQSFAGLSNPFEAMRYHSLLVEMKPIPECLEISARTAEGEIMGLRHKRYSIEGVQFHPESIGTPEGKALAAKFSERLAAMITTREAFERVLGGRSLDMRRGGKRLRRDSR